MRRLTLPMMIGILCTLAPQVEAQSQWTSTSLISAPSRRSGASSVWTGSALFVWGGDLLSVSELNSGGLYDPVLDVWSPTTTTGAPTARFGASAVWTGSRVIVWGGEADGLFLDSGGIYDPATDSWAPMSNVGAPSPRDGHTALWTGERMIIWGGVDDPGPLDTGGIYDPSTDSWTPMSTVGAPSRRSTSAAVWTGSKMIIWGGSTLLAIAPGGAAFDPETNTWAPVSSVGAPPPMNGSTAVWIGSEMIVWGGNDLPYTAANEGGIYNPATDAWRPMTLLGAPEGRSGHLAVWTGARMIVWGGTGKIDSPESFPLLNNGGSYDPATDRWSPTPLVDAPIARTLPSAAWTGRTLLVWGGRIEASPYATNTGAQLAPTMPPVPSAFYTTPPCRVIDTRNPTGLSGGPAVGALSTRSFPITGACGVPSSAKAIAVNLTAVQPVAGGHLTLYRGDLPAAPPSSSLNFSPGRTRANSAVISLAGDGTGTVTLQNASAGSVHVVLDVTGYFE
jgi:N-acetylneuraminic acid mutarotase